MIRGKWSSTEWKEHNSYAHSQPNCPYIAPASSILATIFLPHLVITDLFLPRVSHHLYIMSSGLYTFLFLCGFSRVELGEEFNSSCMLKEKPLMVTHNSYYIGTIIYRVPEMCVPIHDFVSDRWRILVNGYFFSEIPLTTWQPYKLK